MYTTVALSIRQPSRGSRWRMHQRGGHEACMVVLARRWAVNLSVLRFEPRDDDIDTEAEVPTGVPRPRKEADGIRPGHHDRLAGLVGWQARLIDDLGQLVENPLQ